MAGQNSPYLQFNPNSFFGGKRIDARPRNVEYEEGTGPGTGRTARRVDPGMGGGLDSFYMAQRYKDLPMSMINREANIRRGQGMMYNPYAGTYQRDSMYNRSGVGYGREPQAGMQQPQAPAMTEPQMQWAQKAQEKQAGAAALGKIGDKMANSAAITGVNPMFGAGMQLTNAAMQGVQNSQQSPVTPNPYVSSRQQNIANAKAAGEFDKVRADYNKKNEATGMVMDEEGNITRSPEIAAKDRAAEKTMMSNLKRGVDYTTSGSTTSFTSPYGRGSITTSMAPGRPQSMVRDEFGRMVPMSPYLKEKDVTQRSQGMTGGSSVLGGNRPAANVIPSGTAQPKAATPIATPAKEQPKAPTAKAAETPKLIAESVDKKVAAEQKPLTPSEKRKLTLLENKYKAQGIASDEMKALDADRSAMMVGRNRLFQEIENQQETVTKGSPFGGRPYQYQKTLSPQELAEKVNQLEKLEEAIKENYKKSQELGNKRKIPEDVMKEWLELSSRANAR
jgi:hypothetical protein